MSNDFEIKNGVLVKYHGSDAHVTVPDDITEIGSEAFEYCKSLTVFCPRFSYARKYCKKNTIPVKSIKHAKKQ